MQLFSLHGSGIALSLCVSTKTSREEAMGLPFRRVWKDVVSVEGATFQTDTVRSWTEGQNAQQSQQMMKPEVAAMQAGRCC